VASNLDFLNKNLYRRYPFRVGAELLSVNGLTLPDDVISSCSITTQLAINNLWIPSITIRNGFVSVVVEHYDSNPDDCVVIGTFTGQITDDLQSLRMTPFLGSVDGYMIFGAASNIALYTGTYTFTYPDAILEPSTVFCYAPPAVTSLVLPNGTLSGNVVFGNLTNLTESTSALPSEVFTLSVTDTSGILSLADFSSDFRNCPTPEILKINSATPYPVDSTHSNDANIYLLGVDPITMSPDPDTASLNILTPGFDLGSLCGPQSNNLPPVNPLYLINRSADSFTGTARYYSKSQTPVVDFLYSTAPEFKLWPGSVLTYVADFADTVNGTYVIFNHSTDTPLLQSGQVGNITRIKLQVDSGSCTANFLIGATSIAPNSYTVTDEGLVLVPTADANFVPASDFSIMTTSTSGTPNVTVTVFYNIIQS